MTIEYKELTRFEQPWPHYLIDNFFDHKFFNSMINLKNHDDFKLVDSSLENLKNVPYDIPDRPKKYSLKLFKDIRIRNYVKYVVHKQLSTILPPVYFVLPDLIKCEPGYHYPPHRDNIEKKYSIVVYLYPAISNATNLLTKDKNITIPWKTNRALIFEQTSHGMHYYKNDTNENRLTMNIYITAKDNLLFYI